MAELINAGEFATAAEERAAKLFQVGLPDDWIVICNKVFVPDGGGSSRELDFLIIGTRCVFVIDDKDWHGLTDLNQTVWVSRGYSAESPLVKLEMIKRRLGGYINKRVPDAGNSIVPEIGVLVSGMDRLPPVTDAYIADHVFVRSDICMRLQAINARSGIRRLGLYRDGLRKMFYDMSVRPKVPQWINDFKIEEKSEGRAGATVYRAVHNVPGGGPYNLIVYDLSQFGSERLAMRDFYIHQYTALHQLRTTGLVAETSVPFDWSDDFLVMPMGQPAGQRLAARPRPQTADELVAELELAGRLFESLAELHARHIVHRALSPGALYLSDAGQVCFTDFLAARLSDAGQTISPRLNELMTEDPYAAPEIAANYGLARPASDVFSLALIVLERVSQRPLSDLRGGPKAAVAVPGLQAIWSGLPSALNERLEALLRRILETEGDQARMTASEVASELKAIVRLKSGGTGLDPDLLGADHYVVKRHLGRGALANTYLAYDKMRERDVAVKQFMQESEVIAQARSEYRALEKIDKSPHLPRILDINPPSASDHIVLEYIPGNSLAVYESEFPWSLDRWRRLAQDLLQAVTTLEEHGILHRDIKPENIMIHAEDERAVLIDFGYATAAGQRQTWAGTLKYMPPELMDPSRPPLSTDRYALAVVLFRALTGYWPFEDETNLYERKTRLPSQLAEPRQKLLAGALLATLDNDPLKRPATAAALAQLLDAAWTTPLEQSADEEQTAEQSEQINEWVDRLRGLYRNSATGNLDNRGLDSEFARQTYVPTALDTGLLPAILEKKPAAVFLSGNPGDGKTAFLARLRDELKRQGAVFPPELDDASGWEGRLAGHIFRACYDASESHQGRSADEQLGARLAGLEGDEPPAPPLTVLVAINDGRLVDYCETHLAFFGWLTGQITQGRQVGSSLSDSVWLVDLKKRAFVGLDAARPGVVGAVSAKLLDAGQWVVCGSCQAQAVCPIYRNARKLGEAQTAQRLNYLLLVNHLRRTRHLTMRDLRSALAYLITANLSCQEVHARRHGTQSGPPFVDLAYWHSAFAPVEPNDELLQALRPLDPARFPQPALDRFLHFYRGSDEGDGFQRGSLFSDGLDLDPHQFADETARLQAMKRRLYFESQADEAVESEAGWLGWQSWLPYRHAAEFIRVLAGQDDRAATLGKLAVGIFRSDGGLTSLTPGYLRVQVKASEAQGLTVLKQFPLADFRLRVDAPGGLAEIEVIPEVLRLEYEPVAGLRLEITLDLFELLLRLADGLQPNAPEYQSLLEDLVPFKSALLLSESQELILIEASQKATV